MLRRDIQNIAYMHPMLVQIIHAPKVFLTRWVMACGDGTSEGDRGSDMEEGIAKKSSDGGRA